MTLNPTTSATADTYPLTLEDIDTIMRVLHELLQPPFTTPGEALNHRAGASTPRNGELATSTPATQEHEVISSPALDLVTTSQHHDVALSALRLPVLWSLSSEFAMPRNGEVDGLDDDLFPDYMNPAYGYNTDYSF